MLDYDSQQGWAIEQGGRGLSTVERVLYVAVLRPYTELGVHLPYMGGWIRCSNAYYNPESSLGVSFDADFGLFVSKWVRNGWRWYMGALPEKFQALDA